MGLISFTTITDGTTADAADVNTPLSTIYDEFNGNISAANLASDAVTNAKMADASVLPEQLVSGAGTSWAMQSWTPTYANLTAGNGTTTAKYVKIGTTVFYRLVFVLGSTSAVGSSPTFTLPVTSITYPGTAAKMIIGEGSYFDTSAGSSKHAKAFWATTTTARLIALDGADSTGYNNLSSTVPFTWATGDEIHVQGWYEAA